MNTPSILIAIGWLLTGKQADAASISINWSNDRPFSTLGLSTLDAGGSADGDGTLLELGYYRQATTTSLFDGDWTVLTTATVGDAGVNQRGYFNVLSVMIGGTVDEPPVGTPLAIRFYDSTSVASSSYFNAVSNIDGSWNWIAPADPAPLLVLQAFKIAGIRFQGGIISDFSTTIPIPEPTSSLLVLCGGMWLVLRRYLTA